MPACSFRRLFLPGCLLVAFAWGTGCETFGPYDGPVEPPQMALSGAFTPDSAWHVRLYRMHPFNEPAPEDVSPPVADATVTVEDVATGGRLTLWPDGEGGYRAPGGERPAAGQAYRIGLAHPVLGQATAQDAAPAAPVFSASDPTFVRRDTLGDTPVARYRMRIEVEGVPGGAFLVLGVNQVQPPRPYENDKRVRARPIRFTTSDPAWRYAHSDTGPVQGMTTFVGESAAIKPLPPGQKWAFDVEFETVVVPRAARRVLLSIRALSPALHAHLVTVSRQFELGDDPFAEPVHIESNVTGGKGIFGGYHSTTIEVATPLPY